LHTPLLLQPLDGGGQSAGDVQGWVQNEPFAA
jgi:hypothetical protein